MMATRLSRISGFVLKGEKRGRGSPADARDQRFRQPGLAELSHERAGIRELGLARERVARHRFDHDRDLAPCAFGESLDWIQPDEAHHYFNHAGYATG